MSPTSGSRSANVSFVLCRLVVPIWVLTGAVFKLSERTPANLPSQIWRNAQAAGIDLFILLATLISIEFIAVAVMFFVPRFARASAIFMLSVFCLVLLNEMRTGNFTSCGCLGDIPIKPWQMLLIDGSLLLGVVLFKPFRAKQGESSGNPQPRFAPLAAMIAMIVGVTASFGLIMPLRQPPQPQANIDPGLFNPDASTEAPTVPLDPTVNPNPLPLPPYITADELGNWIGKPWRDVPVFGVMPKWPKIADTGKHYVVLYSRTCEHCEAMFYDHLLIPLDAPVSALEIPSSRDVLTAEGAWEMPPTPAELLPLPLGTTWMITPPLAMTIVDGKVTCAVEAVGFEKCLGLE